MINLSKLRTNCLTKTSFMSNRWRLSDIFLHIKNQNKCYIQSVSGLYNQNFNSSVGLRTLTKFLISNIKT